MKKVCSAGVLFFLVCVCLHAFEDDTRSVRRRIMDASRPQLESSLLLPLSAGFAPSVLVNIPTSFRNVNVIDSESDSKPMQNESSIAANPRDPRFLIASAVDYRGAQSAWVYVSSDAGQSWKNVNLGKPDGLSFVVGNDPSVAWDAEGRGFMVYGGFDEKRVSGENAVFISITTDNGATWTKHIPVILHKGTMTKDSAFEDKYYISVDNAANSPYKGHLYIPWKRVYDSDSSTQIVITKSTDHGATWAAPRRISSILTGKSLDTTFGQSFPIAATGPNGEVYVAWNYGPLHSIGFASSSDGGSTWSAPRNVISYEWLGQTMFTGSQFNHTLKGGTRVESYPSLVVDTTASPRRGWLYLSWAADRTPNVYFARSTNGGATWSTPVIVHRDTLNDQYWQWMALDGSNGDLAITFLDSRDDPDNRMSRAYVSISRDGGTTWTDRPVGDASFDIRRNPFGTKTLSGVFAGDYSGCAFINGKVYPSNVDMRNTYPAVEDNDVYTAVVNINTPMPVENLTARTIVQRPSSIALSWTPPSRRAFGETLSASSFSQCILRDGALWRVVAGSVSSIDDDSVPAYTQHVYDVFVVASGANDTSVMRRVVGFAGGAPQPLGGRLIRASNMGDSLLVHVQTPSLRADSVNALVNLAFVRVMLDSALWVDVPVSASDTAQTLTLRVPVPEPGYYDLRIAIGDSKNNVSMVSNAMVRYVGPIATSLNNSFDATTLPRYLRRGGWSTTGDFALSAPNSLTESKGAQYAGLARDTLQLFPIRAASNDGVPLHFYHAAIIDKSDTAFVEYAPFQEDMSSTSWSVLGAYNRTLFSEWQNTDLNAADWRSELLNVPAVKDSIVVLRLRFKSNLVTNADGWYVDDLAVGSSVNAVNTGGDISTLFAPNPASQELSVLASGRAQFSIYTMLGELRYSGSVDTGIHQRVDISSWESGTYVIVVREGNVRRSLILSVVR